MFTDGFSLQDLTNLTTRIVLSKPRRAWADHVREDEMKTCPHCDTMMEEQPDSGGEMLKIPQQLADDQPQPMRVNRRRWRCPKCSHLEEGLPVAHGGWDKSDPPQT
jgi:hypothetical protein